MRRVLHLIDGQEVPSLDEQTFRSYSPATGEPIAEVALGSAADVDRAVQSAHRAFKEGPWSRLAPTERGRILRRIADLLRQRAPELARLETMDSGKPLSNSLYGDLEISANIFEFYAGACDKLTGKVYPTEPGYHAFSLREPYGVVGAIAPWNFPLYNSSLKVSAALTAGNAVVVKMAEQTPMTTLELGRICLEAGLPEGVMNVINGDGPTTGAALVRHPGVAKISFTGSTAVGKEILRSAAEQVKSVSLELGGKTANIVLDDADLEQALAGTLFTSFYNMGQICTAGTRLLVHEAIAEEFIARLAERAKALRIGDPLAMETQLGALVSKEQYDRVQGYIQAGRTAGARVVCGGGTRPVLPDQFAAGCFLEPTIFADVTPDMRIAREEIFGPVLSVIRFRDIDEAIRIANSTQYGLAATIWTNDVRRLHRLAHALEAGIIWGNTVHYLNPNTPYSGHKQSGLGEEMGMEGLHEYTKLKTVLLNYGGAVLKW